MPYATVDDIRDVIIPAEELQQLVDDERDGNEGEHWRARITSVIQRADDEIDARLLGLYDVPFTSAPKIIRIISAKLAAYYLWSRRSGEKPENIVAEYTWCQRMLDRIARRELQLFAAAPVKNGPRLVDAPEAVFGKSTLDRMP